MKIYKKFIVEAYSFLADKIMDLSDKIKANKAQYSLDKEPANVSSLSSGKFHKYEYLTGKELIIKLGPMEKTKSLG